MKYALSVWNWYYTNWIIENTQAEYGIPAEVVITPETVIAEPEDAVQTTNAPETLTVKENLTGESSAANQDKSVSLQPEAAAHTPETPPVQSEISDRGSEQHRYLQSLVKRIGEREGYLSTTEKPVFGGAGRIDVALETDALKIAVEIAVTNTAGYELQNIQKCLAAGFDKVVVIAPDDSHLREIQEAAETALPGEMLARVAFLSPEAFYEWLKLNSVDDADDASGKVKGYSVTTSYTADRNAETEARETLITEIIKNAGRRDKDVG